METRNDVYRLLRRMPTDSDLETINREIDRLTVQGWSTNEIARYCNCTEEVSPHLPEDVALARMHRIVKEVEQRIKV